MYILKVKTKKTCLSLNGNIIVDIYFLLQKHFPLFSKVSVNEQIT